MVPSLERIDLSFSLSTLTWIGLVCRLDLCEYFFWSTLSPTPLSHELVSDRVMFVLGLGALSHIKCFNNLVPKYLNQFFTRSRYFHVTRKRNDLHPTKPKHNLGKRTFKYAGTICINALLACIKSAPPTATPPPPLSNFKTLIIKHFYL